MSLGIIALILCVAGAGWMLWRLAKGESASANRQSMLLKGVVWLGLAAALFAAKLWPLALMVLFAAGGVMAIETWRDKAVREDQGPVTPAPLRAFMDIDEAASVLGIEKTADPDVIKSAHRKLIAQIHPDKGGTDYLAAKINEARDIMLAMNDEG